MQSCSKKKCADKNEHASIQHTLLTAIVFSLLVTRSCFVNATTHDPQPPSAQVTLVPAFTKYFFKL